MPDVKVQNLTVSYGSLTALEDLSVTFQSGSSVAVLGPNGSGKSSLINALAGIVKPSKGTIQVHGRLGLLPQQIDINHSFPLTVEAAVKMGAWPKLGLLKPIDSATQNRVDEALFRLGISEIRDRRICELSGGQRQRTFFAQLSVQNPDLILLDEPLTGVDITTGETIYEIITEWKEQGKIILVATHDVERASKQFDYVLCLNKKLIGYGPAATVCNEETLKATFTGHIVRVGDSVFDTSHHHHGAS